MERRAGFGVVGEFAGWWAARPAAVPNRLLAVGLFFSLVAGGGGVSFGLVWPLCPFIPSIVYRQAVVSLFLGRWGPAALALSLELGGWGRAGVSCSPALARFWPVAGLVCAWRCAGCALGGAPGGCFVVW